MLKDYSTADLVSELSQREAVEVEKIQIYEKTKLEIEGSAVVLVVRD
ncbi:hypothetical protein AGMMS49975_25960 [Clostridia bacterium]|nr:hypothetical protein AGMMS49975_25960 [Clostridia bacterium]